MQETKTQEKRNKMQNKLNEFYNYRQAKSSEEDN